MLSERDIMQDGNATAGMSDENSSLVHRGSLLPGLRTDELDYELPPKLIATRPVEGRRDSARMMVLHRSEPERQIEHRHVRDLPEYVREGDVMVFNTSAVVRARLTGYRVGSGGRVEGLFLEETSKGPNVQTSKDAPFVADVQHSAPSTEHSARWLVMLRSNGRLRVGDQIALVDARGEDAGVTLELLDRSGVDWVVDVASNQPTIALLERVGRTPLPPYILRARGREMDLVDELDRAWYETVYADPSLRKSVAAPTAGLHFTPELLARMDERGVRRLNVVLHVGAGTFQPVKTQTLEEHRMHEERYEVPAATVEGLRAVSPSPTPGTWRGERRIIAVGTTAVRTLESLPADLGSIAGPVTGTTDLMIAPGYSFKHVDGLLTNFHLPRSTLLALVAALVGLDRLKAVYREAIEREYRFYSYGDCMLILP